MILVPAVDTNGVAPRTDTSSAFDDTAVKMTRAIDQEVERIVRLGLPVWVSRDGVIENLNTDLVLTRRAGAVKSA